MISVINSVCISGVRGLLTTVETYVGKGMNEFNIIGLAGASVKESKNRVCAAMKYCGYELPKGRITVNLAPSDVRKEGTVFDLAIAAGLLAVSGELPPGSTDNMALIGELSLNGGVRPVTGAFSMCVSALQNGISEIVLPLGNLDEVSGLEGLHIRPVSCLDELIPAVKLAQAPVIGRLSEVHRETEYTSIRNIKGHKTAKRALEIAAAGKHNLLMLGAAGSGKTLLAHSVRSILPPLEKQDIYDVTSIYSLSGLLDKDTPLICDPPFREIHIGITKTALIGGGRPVVPGEISLAHRGVLFMDEVTELERPVIDALRQPMDSGEVNVSRVGHIEKLPADFMLIMAANPCRCGNLFEGREKCTCTPKMVSNTLGRLSRPVLDRIDIHIPVRSPEYAELTAPAEESAETVRARVAAVRKLQKERLDHYELPARPYSLLTGDELDKVCNCTPAAQKLLEAGVEKLSSSVRAYNKIKAVARTVADLNGHENVAEEDMAEALSYRAMDQRLFGDRGYQENAA
ncbi:MAG: YifB family Mg chelatase-like AAA ATPase, partial [Clostridia bacterium]|nr:YifB family Mg chelatase-like AAA ATPase [Clostridia bacterium]